MSKDRVVVCAANRYGDHIFTGVRHFCAIMRENMRHHDIPWMRREFGEVQGFIDQWGIFMDRKEAHAVASAAGQIKYRCGGDDNKLFSENLY